MKVENLKKEIANLILNINIEGIDIAKYQSKPKVFSKLPAITYSLISDHMIQDFSGLSRQEGIFQVDIWAETNVQISKILIKLKEECIKRCIYYKRGNDFNDPSGIKRFICQLEIKN